MWEDLQRGRKTEIAAFQGAIMRLAREHGMDAPRSGSDLVREAGGGKDWPGLRPGRTRFEARDRPGGLAVCGPVFAAAGGGARREADDEARRERRAASSA